MTSSNRNLTIPSWGALIGRHTRGGNANATQLLFYNFGQQTPNVLLPGDYIICVRIVDTSNIIFGNGVILNPDISLINGSPVNNTVPHSFINTIYPIGSQFTGNSAPNIGTWERIGWIGQCEMHPITTTRCTWTSRINCDSSNILQIAIHVQSIRTDLQEFQLNTNHGVRARARFGYQINNIINYGSNVRMDNNIASNFQIIYEIRWAGTDDGYNQIAISNVPLQYNVSIYGEIFDITLFRSRIQTGRITEVWRRIA